MKRIFELFLAHSVKIWNQVQNIGRVNRLHDDINPKRNDERWPNMISKLLQMFHL